MRIHRIKVTTKSHAFTCLDVLWKIIDVTRLARNQPVAMDGMLIDGFRWLHGADTKRKHTAMEESKLRKLLRNRLPVHFVRVGK